jgi:hypothetical protein
MYLSVLKPLWRPILLPPSKATKPLASLSAALPLNRLPRVLLPDTAISLHHLWVPLRDPSHELRVAIISNEGPALLDVAVIIESNGRVGYGGVRRVGGRGGTVLDQRLGVFEIPIYGLDSGFDAVFLGIVGLAL